MLNRLEMTRIFCAAADAGSFKAAAIRLGISPQAVTRAIQELEQLQGEMLFHRNTRQIRITAFGAALAEKGRAAVGQLDAMFERGENQADTELAGLVRLTAPSVYGRKLIVPALSEIAERYPQISFELLFNDRRADVVSDKIDIGVRIGAMRDNRFVAKLLTKARFHIVATPDFIRRHGIPKTIAQLNDYPTSALMDSNTGRPWPWSFAGGVDTLPGGQRITCDDSEAELMLVKAGLVYSQLPDFLVDSALREGELQSVLHDFAPDPWSVYIFRPQRGPTPARVRVIYEYLTRVLTVAES